MVTRPLVPVEVCFRLGDQLLRINRLESAAAYFEQGQKLAPRSPFPLEGLGLLSTAGLPPCNVGEATKPAGNVLTSTWTL